MTFESAKLGTFSGRRTLYAAVASLFSNGPVQSVPNSDFYAPLTSTVIASGFGAPSFTRATTRTVTDHEGKVNTLLAGEVGFTGARRVRNQIADSENYTTANWTRSNAGAGTAPVVASGQSITYNGKLYGACRVQMALNGGNTTADQSFIQPTVRVAGTAARAFSVIVQSNTAQSYNVQLRLGSSTPTSVLITPVPQRFGFSNIGDGDQTNWVALRGGQGCSDSCDILVTAFQTEDVTGQQNQNPGEYVSVGAFKSNEIVDTAIITFTNATNTTPAPGVDRATLTGGLVSHLASKPGIVGRVPDNAYVVLSAVVKGDGTIPLVAFEMRNKAAGFFTFRVNPNNGTINTNTCDGGLVTALPDGSFQLTCWKNVGVGATETLTWALYVGGYGTYSGDGQFVDVSNPIAVISTVAPTAHPAYFPVGNVYPYAGSCVDGVKCFEFYNGNTVAANVVTAGVGQTIGQKKNQTAYLSGLSASDFFSTPDAAANRIGSSFSIVVGGAMASWSAPTANIPLYSKWGGSTPLRAYNTLLTTLGQLWLQWADTSATIRTATASVNPSTVFANGTIGFVKIDFLDTTPNASVTFWTGPTATGPWTQLGVTQVIAASGGVQTSVSQIVQIGGNTAAWNPYQACLYNGINGKLTACFVPNDYTSGNTFPSAATGETWTLNGGAKINNFPLVGYLGEQASTNPCFQSESFSTAPWTVINTPTVTPGAKRCGSVLLDLLSDADAGSNDAYAQTVTFTADAVKAVSFFFAQGTSAQSVVQLVDTTAATDKLRAVITWANGVPTVTCTIGTLLGVDALGNGVFRGRVQTIAVTAANVNSLRVHPANDATFTPGFTGAAYFGGMQAENNTLCTSYIPTTTAAVTRNSDVLAYASAGNLNGTDGTAYAEVTYATTVSGTDVLSTFTGAGAGIVMNLVTGGNIGLYDGASRTVPCGLPAAPVTSPLKVASKWSSSALQCNAAQAGTLGTAQTFDGDMNFGATMWLMTRNAGASNFPNGNIRNVRLWKTALSDQQLKDLTT